MGAVQIKAYEATSSQLNAIKALMKALKIKFEVSKTAYNPQFIEKIKKSEKEIEQGQFKHVQKEDLKSFLGL